VSRKWRNWYRNEVDEEIKGAHSSGKVKHNERSDPLFFRYYHVAGGRARERMFYSEVFKTLTAPYQEQITKQKY